MSAPSPQEQRPQGQQGPAAPGPYEPYGAQPGFDPRGYPPSGPVGDPTTGGHPSGPMPGYAPGPMQAGPVPGAPDPTDVVPARIGQYLLDALVAVVPVVVGAILLGTVAAALGDVVGAVFGFLAAALYVIGLLGGPWFVLAYWPSTHEGRTPAMGWLGLRIVDEHTGAVPTLGALTLRWLLLIVDGLFAGIVGLVIMSTNPRHQRLGDQVAKTLVVRG